MFMASPSAGFHSSVSAALFYCPNALHYLYRYDRDVLAAQPCLQPREQHEDEMTQANQPFIYCNLFTCSSKCRLIISVCACRSKEVSPQHRVFWHAILVNEGFFLFFSLSGNNENTDSYYVTCRNDNIFSFVSSSRLGHRALLQTYQTQIQSHKSLIHRHGSCLAVELTVLFLLVVWHGVNLAHQTSTKV